jgi:hypothetical protein
MEIYTSSAEQQNTSYIENLQLFLLLTLPKNLTFLWHLQFSQVIIIS